MAVSGTLEGNCQKRFAATGRYNYPEKEGPSLSPGQSKEGLCCMERKTHFMVTSERGATRSFSVSTDILAAAVFACCLLLAGSLGGWLLFSENVFLRHRVAGLERDLSASTALNRNIQARADSQEQEQQALLNNALVELKQRSQIIESILKTVGVELEVKESSEGAGGPFSALPGETYESLTLRVDHYLATIQSVPLGPPVPGTITSWFGRRVDPLNSSPAFHSGIDIRNRTGTRVVAPADGVVTEQGYTAGFGNYIEIDHGNSFLTRYLHLQSKKVQRGDRVARGQVIGLLGNTGRSTGPHLHYELQYRDRPVDPAKFVQIGSHIAALRQRRELAL